MTLSHFCLTHVLLLLQRASAYGARGGATVQPRHHLARYADSRYARGALYQFDGVLRET